MQNVLDFAAPLRTAARLHAIEAPKGVWYGKRIVGYSWYIGETHRPAPYSFGVGLSELELFLLDTIDRRSHEDTALPYLLGIGQGAGMALSIATVQPELLSGVIAVDSRLPIVPGWTPPLTTSDGLPVLLIDRDDAGEPTDVVGALREWDAVVERCEVTDDTAAITAIADWLKLHPVRRDS